MIIEPTLKQRKYSRLSLSRSRMDPLKHFEISVLRHIRFAELRKYQSNNQISQMNMSFDYFSEKYMLKILWKMIEIAEEQFHLLSTICSYLM